jgi:hypothetical protein
LYVSDIAEFCDSGVRSRGSEVHWVGEAEEADGVVGGGNFYAPGAVVGGPDSFDGNLVGRQHDSVIRGAPDHQILKVVLGARGVEAGAPADLCAGFAEVAQEQIVGDLSRRNLPHDSQGRQNGGCDQEFDESLHGRRAGLAANASEQKSGIEPIFLS